MRPKDLKSPFAWQSRRVMIEHYQRILYVPERCQRVDLKKELTKIINEFENVQIEFCSGNGDWVCQKAQHNPKILWVAVEKKFERVQKIWSKIQNTGLKNVFIVCGEALEVATYYLEDCLVDEIYINFPDPWPKNKHAKFRLIELPFTKQIHRLLKPYGKINFVTDDKNYSSKSIQVFLEGDYFDSQFSDPFYRSDIQEYGTSYFRSLWEEKKRGFYFSKFQKKCKHKS